jgi:2-methylcitrate dehydratase PrpD
MSKQKDAASAAMDGAATKGAVTNGAAAPSNEDVTGTLARYVAQSRPADLPQEVLHEASRALLNWMGCAIGASRHETIDNAIAALAPFFGPAQAQILGRSERADALHAALLNGISSHVLDFDDTHYRAVHPSAPVLPALLAYAEWRPTAGLELAHAFALGVEVEERVGLSVFPEHYDRGYHITGTAGVFGAAAATGVLLKLDPQRMAWALGIAATQSAGLREMFGSMCKSLHPGKAAQNGMSAALMAQHGYTSSERGIEAPRGWAHVTSTRFDPKVITEGLGASYELMRNMYKPFACGLVLHAAIDGCLQLRREHGLTGVEIRAIHARVNPLVLELTGKKTPRTGLEGKFSVYHALAVAIVQGAAGEAQFSAEAVLDPRVLALRDRVTATQDSAVGKLEAYVVIELVDGRTLELHVPHALGTLQRPMSDADLEDKFRGLCDGILPRTQMDEIIGLCWELPRLPDAGVLARAAATRD